MMMVIPPPRLPRLPSPSALVNILTILTGIYFRLRLYAVSITIPTTTTTTVTITVTITVTTTKLIKKRKTTAGSIVINECYVYYIYFMNLRLVLQK